MTTAYPQLNDWLGQIAIATQGSLDDTGRMLFQKGACSFVLETSIHRAKAGPAGVSLALRARIPRSAMTGPPGIRWYGSVEFAPANGLEAAMLGMGMIKRRASADPELCARLLVECDRRDDPQIERLLTSATGSQLVRQALDLAPSGVSLDPQSGYLSVSHRTPLDLSTLCTEWPAGRVITLALVLSNLALHVGPIVPEKPTRPVGDIVFTGVNIALPLVGLFSMAITAPILVAHDRPWVPRLVVVGVTLLMVHLWPILRSIRRCGAPVARLVVCALVSVLFTGIYPLLLMVNQWLDWSAPATIEIVQQHNRRIESDGNTTNTCELTLLAPHGWAPTTVEGPVVLQLACSDLPPNPTTLVVGSGLLGVPWVRGIQ